MPCLAEIQRLEASRYSLARTALGRAFFDYNLMVYAAPDDRRREPAVTSLYDSILWDCFRWGEVYVTADVIGVAAWLPPERAMTTFIRQARSGMLMLPLRFGIGGFRRLVAYDKMAHHLHHRHAPMVHWYLAAIGVVPERQGQGVGPTLIQPIIDRADAAGLHCYLETHRESNVRVYEKSGFAVTENTAVPGHPIPVWAMLRAPR